MWWSATSATSPTGGGPRRRCTSRPASWAPQASPSSPTTTSAPSCTGTPPHATRSDGPNRRRSASTWRCSFPQSPGGRRSCSRSCRCCATRRTGQVSSGSTARTVSRFRWRSATLRCSTMTEATWPPSACTPTSRIDCRARRLPLCCPRSWNPPTTQSSRTMSTGRSRRGTALRLICTATRPPRSSDVTCVCLQHRSDRPRWTNCSLDSLSARA